MLNGYSRNEFSLLLHDGYHIKIQSLTFLFYLVTNPGHNRRHSSNATRQNDLCWKFILKGEGETSELLRRAEWSNRLFLRNSYHFCSTFRVSFISSWILCIYKVPTTVVCEGMKIAIGLKLWKSQANQRV